MKQILQNLKDGRTELAQVPIPQVGPGCLLIRTSRSLVSAGTERMLVDFGKANLIQKARQQPEKVKMVLDKVKTDGLLPTLKAVRNKLDQPLPLGYCNAGLVSELGNGVADFFPGDRVVSNGRHAEVVSVPRTLCARIPESVSDEEAAFTVIGAIALQGIRLVQPTLGETVAVTGLGLIGLVAVQLFRANGCRVLGIDFDRKRLELAQQFGAEVVDLSKGEDPVSAAEQFSRGRGMDAVVITASTKSSEPVHQAALMSRKRGRIVLVGVVGLGLSRADFYEKELTFQVSCSYGPGRYDSDYEEKGWDYPIGFVRWTEQRNFEAVLDMLAEGRLDVKPLISHRFRLEEAVKAYEIVAGSEPSLGIILEYSAAVDSTEPTFKSTVRLIPHPTRQRAVAGVSVGFVGSGNYATSVLIPAFGHAGVRLRTVASKTGVSGVHAGRKYGFEETTTDTDSLFENDGTNVIAVTTRHDTHAAFVLKAIRAGKHVFAEKPLCLTLDELAEIEAAVSEHPECLLMVGFNRRFAPQVVRMKKLLDTVHTPKSLIFTVNAGAIPRDHWTQDPEIGGGPYRGRSLSFHRLAAFSHWEPDTKLLQICNGPYSRRHGQLAVFFR